MSTTRCHDTNTAATLRPGSVVVSIRGSYPLEAKAGCSDRDRHVLVADGAELPVVGVKQDNGCVTGVLVKAQVPGGLTSWLDASWFGVYE